MNFDWRLLRNTDYVLLLVVLSLCVMGVTVVSSAVLGYDPTNAYGYVYRQVAGVVLGSLALVVVVLFDYTEFARMYRSLYVGNLVLLALVWVPGLGLGRDEVGAQSWINLGIVNLQPAELSKVSLILTLAWLLARTESLLSWRELLPAFIHVLPALSLVLLQPDLGTALVFLALSAAMLYAAGTPGWKFLLAALLSVALAVGAVVAHLRWDVPLPLPRHQVERLICWLQPSYDLQGACYNVYQSKLAIATGSLLGKGFAQGNRSQMGYIPENHTDFIFAVVGEEFGFVGAAVVILLFLLLLWRVVVAATQAKDRYGMLICTGAAAMIGFHVVENIGMTMGIMPVTGIPLPFISYGPTAVVANMVAIGLVLNVHMRRQKIMF